MKLTIKDYLFVGLQFILFVFYVLNFDIHVVEIPKYLRMIGLTVTVIGGLILIISLLQLSKNLSPFPTPKSNSQLIQTGLYKYIRHPIYTGILISFIGYSFYSESLYKLAITFILLVLFIFKSKYEENKLSEKFSEYSSYKEKTGRFLPRIF